MRKNDFYILPTVYAVFLQAPILISAELDTFSGSPDSGEGGYPKCVTVLQDFSKNPLNQGWSIFGDSELFQWNPQLQHLEVTWDSSKKNSYFQFSLKTILTRNDDFQIDLDLRLLDIIGGINPEKPSPMQVAFGFQNGADAHAISFNRGSGKDSPNLVEFNYFPDTGYGPTIWPAMFSENSVMNFNGNEDFHIFELPLNENLHITLSYHSESQTVMSSMSLDGTAFGPVTTAEISQGASPFGGKFSQFYLDTFSISTYSDQDLEAGPFSSSILAHGFIDNIAMTFPSPPIQEERHSIVQGNWKHTFSSRENWDYSLESTQDFRTWEVIGDSVKGNGGILSIEDFIAELSKSRFYRINATPAPYDE